MNLQTKDICLQLQKQIDQISTQIELSQDSLEYNKSVQNLMSEITKNMSTDIQCRIENEFFGFGPLEILLKDEDITEILVNSYCEIHFEKQGQICQHEDSFFSHLSYRNCIHRLLEKNNAILSLEKPFCDFKYQDFRVSLVDESISQHGTIVSFRRHPKQKWTLNHLYENGWCTDQEKQLLEKVISTKKNFLVIGCTGAGKTSVTNALLDLTSSQERSLIIEDTQEIQLPNPLSLRLLTRDETHQGLCAIDQSHLVKRALRLRPDRLVMGEIRGHEAKDFLMALSTGHQGSFGTLHAQDPQQALLRLEMLIQMGAPHWKLSAIRRLMNLSMEIIIVTAKNLDGKRKLEGVYMINSLEENGFLIERITSAESLRI